MNKGNKQLTRRNRHKKNKSFNKKYLILTFIFMIVGGYFVANNYYHKTRFKDVEIYGIDLKGMTVNEAFSKITDPENKLNIIVRDREDRDRAIPLSIVTNISRETLQDYFDSGEFNPKLNTDNLESEISNLNLNEGASKAQNAKVIKTKKGFEIQKEFLGEIVNAGSLIKDIGKSINAGNRLKFQVNKYYIQPEVTHSDKNLSKELTKLKQQSSAEIAVQIGDDKIPIPQEKILESVTPAGIEDSAIISFLEPLAAQYTNKGADMEFTTHNGKKVTLNNSTSYTWGIDIDKTKELIKGSILKGESKVVNLEIQGKGYNDKIQLGGNYAEVDLNAQKAYIFKDGKEIFSWNVITGAPTNPTSVGIHEVLYKQSPSVLRGYNNDGTKYASPVKYWIPFTHPGEGFHDADWQTSGFGGDLYRTLGSHGCVNTSPADMEEVWPLMYAGMPVVIWGTIYN